MDLDSLKVFQTVAEEKSISKAAKVLNFVQSNVTVRIKQLESELQTQLFYRHHRGGYPYIGRETLVNLYR